MKNADDLSKQITNARLADVSAKQVGDKWVLTFTREFAHPPERMWDVLTDPVHLNAWSPFLTDRNLASLGPVTLTMDDGDEKMVLHGTVSVVEPPRVLEYSWGTDLLRWELTPIPTGTRLTLEHTLEAEDWLPKVAAGWHICLFVADRLAARSPVRRIVGMDAMDYGWQELHETYAKQLGVEATGLPASLDDRPNPQ